MKSAEEIRNGLARILEGLQRLDERLANLEKLDRDISRRLAVVAEESVRNQDGGRIQTDWSN